MLAEADTTEDAVLGGRLVLRQPKRGHRFGHDAILLAAAVDARPGEIAVDIGAGVGTAGLALAHRVPDLKVRLVEVDTTLADLARENAARNRLSDRVSVATLDVAAEPSAFERHGMVGVDHVLMNPPFNDPANVSPDAARRRAHVAGAGALATWVDCAAALLAARGTLTLIWRATGLSDVLGALGGTFGGIAILPIHPKPSAAAIRILVRAVRGSGAPLVLLPPLMLNGADGTPSAEAEAVLRGGVSLPMTA
jgi:tRNA1(Val) A37 N6-methylase TrmN6